MYSFGFPPAPYLVVVPCGPLGTNSEFVPWLKCLGKYCVPVKYTTCLDGLWITKYDFCTLHKGPVCIKKLKILNKGKKIFP